MNRLFFLVFLLIPFLLINNAYAILQSEQVGDVQIINGRQHKILEINPDGSKKMLFSSWDRWIVDHYDQDLKPVYSEYRKTETANTVKVETTQGSVIFDKTACSFSFYDDGYINQENQSRFTDSIVSKKATVGTTNWSNLNIINNAVCNPVIVQNATSIFLSAIKNKNGVGYVNYEYIYSLGKWKTQLTAFNNGTTSDQKFGFTQTVNLNRDTVKFGNTTVNLQNFNGTTFDRAWIVSHKSKMLDFLNGKNFDFDLAFPYLKQITVYAYANGKSKLMFDYTNTDIPLLPQQKLVLDPTYSSTAGGTFSTLFSGDATRQGIYTKESTSVLKGITINSVTWYLKKTGSPTGTAYTKVYNNAGTLQYTFSTTLDSSTLTGSSTGYTFSGSTVLIEDDRLVFEFSGGSAGNSVDIEYSAAGTFDGTNTIMTQYNAGWTDTPTFNAYDAKFDVVYNTTPKPNKVNDLTVLSFGNTWIYYNWTLPNLNGGTFQNYKFNYTTPYGNPLSGNINTTDHFYNLTGLAFGTQYSARVSVATQAGYNATGNIANQTTSSTTYSNPPLNLNCFGATSTKINIQWTAGTMTNVNGYRIEREDPIGSGWDIIVSNTTTTTAYYNNTGLASNLIYNYRVKAMNSSGISTPSNTCDMTTFHVPNKITDLVATATSLSSIDLSWSAPISFAPEILCYGVNYTTPYGNPQTVLSSCTGSTATTYSVTGIAVGSQTSFRVTAVTIHGRNATGNIANATTFSAFTIGNLTISSDSNPDVLPITFLRDNVNSTQIVISVIYPDTADLDCDVSFTFGQTNSTYAGLIGTPYTTDYDVYNFTLNNLQSELVNFDCIDNNDNSTGHLTVTQTSFPFKDLITQFRAGTFGTSGNFGALDLVTLLVICASMIGFNKENPAAGLIIAMMVLGATSFFGIITLTTQFFGVLALIVMLAIVTTRKP